MSGYRAPWWLPGSHAQTVYPALCLRLPGPALRREIWTTPDDDQIAVDWLDGPAAAPLLIHFHGLEGSSASHYATALFRQLQARGWAGVVVHFRGCGGLPNRQQRAYHAGDSAEIDWVLQRLQNLWPQGPRFALGVSLGGNALLKWAGERGALASDYLQALVGVSIPFDLAAAGVTLDSGLNKRLYTHNFLQTLKQKARRLLDSSVDWQQISTFRAFDDRVTAPLHGFAGVEDYWQRSSCKPWLSRIQLPSLLIHAENDPFLPATYLPHAEELGPNVEFLRLTQGGHAGFVSGRFPGNLDWLPKTACDWLEGVGKHGQRAR